MRITILGSGTSHGIPVAGCPCRVCHSEDSRDRRSRASIFIEGKNGETAVIDTGPEFRLQAINAGIRRLDAVFLTHAHADHVHGLDDVRPFCREKPMPVYANRQTVKEIRERFSYVFRRTQPGGGKPKIAPVKAAAPVRIGSLLFTPVPVRHGALRILGWRINEDGGGAAAYLTDVSAIPRSSMEILGKPGILIIDGLRSQPHPTHFSFDQALNAAADIEAEQVFLTHISHDHFHQEINRYCLEYREKRKLHGLMEAAWDGLTLSL
ncbi:MAG: MBL fold metallo-hydrolase [Treponema sp.]|jgi:phosphoribosyl 1,2-cyclic phosphate phosphodiesterase|nr:MBL fold metallo-hydrolase [Treponema sp.]